MLHLKTSSIKAHPSKWPARLIPRCGGLADARPDAVTAVPEADRRKANLRGKAHLPAVKMRAGTNVVPPGSAVSKRLAAGFKIPAINIPASTTG
jgi:hypothetical protein